MYNEYGPKLPEHLGREIIRVPAGSEAYGTSVGPSDKDYMGVFVAPPKYVTGIHNVEHWKWRTKPEGVRSEVGDIDLSLYELRHFARLCLKGNPHVLQVLFSAPITENCPVSDWRDEMAKAVWSQQAASSFLGYMQAQRERMVKGKGHHVPYRPELVEKYGFDTKYAFHIIRLGLQGNEYLTYGKLRLPMHEEFRKVCIDIRNGEYTQQEVLDMALNLEESIKRDKALAPKEPNVDALNRLLQDIYMEVWDAGM